jgi:hypothetical protein
VRDGLTKGGVAADKARLEGELQKWIDADAGRKTKYGDVLARWPRWRPRRRRPASTTWPTTSCSRARCCCRSPTRSSSWPTSGQKPDAERKLGFQERDQKDLEQGFGDGERVRGRERTARLQAVPAARRQAAGGRAPRAAGRDGRQGHQRGRHRQGPERALQVDQARRHEDPRRAAAHRHAGDAGKSSKDPFIKLALKIKPVVDAQKARGEAQAGALAVLRPRYIEALRGFTGDLAPDANGTLRVTFGTIRGYTPPGKTAAYTPFTKLSEVVAKHTGEEPFAAPKALLEAVAAKKFGPYVDPTIGEVPVDFLADLDITGGNSGSATLNAKGELTGLVFDGNIEAMASDWVFMPPITRSIHVDIRYVLWVMDAVDNADHLLTEMGVTPAI